MAEKKFPEGINVQRPKVGAPDFVKARVWIRKDEFMHWLTTQGDDSINLDLMESKKGKLYFAVDDWKPDNQGENEGTSSDFARPPVEDFDDDIPF
jgi:hypothetical protein